MLLANPEQSAITEHDVDIKTLLTEAENILRKPARCEREKREIIARLNTLEASDFAANLTATKELSYSLSSQCMLLGTELCKVSDTHIENNSHDRENANALRQGLSVLRKIYALNAEITALGNGAAHIVDSPGTTNNHMSQILMDTSSSIIREETLETLQALSATQLDRAVGRAAVDILLSKEHQISGNFEYQLTHAAKTIAAAYHKVSPECQAVCRLALRCAIGEHSARLAGGYFHLPKSNEHDDDITWHERSDYNELNEALEEAFCTLQIPLSRDAEPDVQKILSSAADKDYEHESILLSRNTFRRINFSLDAYDSIVQPVGVLDKDISSEDLEARLKQAADNAETHTSSGFNIKWSEIYNNYKKDMRQENFRGYSLPRFLGIRKKAGTLALKV